MDAMITVIQIQVKGQWLQCAAMSCGYTDGNAALKCFGAKPVVDKLFYLACALGCL